jgi:hypothetical protein
MRSAGESESGVDRTPKQVPSDAPQDANIAQTPAENSQVNKHTPEPWWINHEKPRGWTIFHGEKGCPNSFSHPIASDVTTVPKDSGISDLQVHANGELLVRAPRLAHVLRELIDFGVPASDKAWDEYSKLQDKAVRLVRELEAAGVL